MSMHLAFMHLSSDNYIDVLIHERRCTINVVLRHVETMTPLLMAVGFSKTIQTSNKNFNLDVGMEREQKHLG